MIDPGEAAARTFYNNAGGNYPMPAQPAPAAAVAPVAPAAAPVAAAVASVPADEPPAPTAATEPAAAAMALYEAPPTRGLVDWSEPVAAPADFDLPAPPGLLDRSEAGVAALGRLRDGLAAAGAGVTVARELFSDAVRAQQDGRWRVGREQAEAELRQHFGDRYDAKIAAAAGLVQRAAQRCPEIVPFLEKTGLGNSPEFIRKLAAAAGRRAR